MTAFLSSETIKVRGRGTIFFKSWKKHFNHQSSILYSAKYPLGINGRKKKASEGKLREFFCYFSKEIFPRGNFPDKKKITEELEFHKGKNKRMHNILGKYTGFNFSWIS